MLVVGYLFLPDSGDAHCSIAEQQRLISQYGREMSYRVRDFFIEEQGSFQKFFLDRIEGQKVISLLQSGDMILVAKAAFVLGSARQGLHLIHEMKKHQIGLHCIDLGGDIIFESERKLVVSKGVAPLIEQLFSALVRCESERHGESIRQTKKQQKKEGKYLGGPVPFGWQVGSDGLFKQHVKQQKIIAKMKQLRKDRWSYRDISKKLWQEHQVKLSHEGVRKTLAANDKKIRQG